MRRILEATFLVRLHIAVQVEMLHDDSAIFRR